MCEIERKRERERKRKRERERERERERMCVRRGSNVFNGKKEKKADTHLHEWNSSHVCVYDRKRVRTARGGGWW